MKKAHEIYGVYMRRRCGCVVLCDKIMFTEYEDAMALLQQRQQDAAEDSIRQFEIVAVALADRDE